MKGENDKAAGGDLLDDLLALRDELASAGFDPGVQRTIAAHNLLIVLSLEGHLPPDRGEWVSLLAPIFCSTPQQQADFPRIFATWAARSVKPAGEQSGAAPGDRAGIPSILRRLLRAVIPSITFKWLNPARHTRILVPALASLLLVAGWLAWPRTVTVEGEVVSGNNNNPLAGAEINLPGESGRTVDADGRFRLEASFTNYQLLRNRSAGRSILLRVSGPDHLTEYRRIDLSPGLISAAGVEAGRIALRPIVRETQSRVKGRLQEWNGAPPLEIPLSQPNWSVFIGEVVFILAPVLIWLIWLALASILRRAWLQSLPSDVLPNIGELRVARSETRLFASAAERRLMLELRRPRHQSSREINPQATVRRTVRDGGAFTPVFGRRRVSPEYLLLIDCVSPGDHQATIAEEFCRQLVQQGIFVDPWVFDGDPNFCRNLRKPAESAVSLDWLAGRFPEHRLLIFSDGASLFDKFTGRPRPWLARLAHWETCILLTPGQFPGSTSQREQLSELNLFQFRTNIRGLSDLGQWLHQGVSPAPVGEAASDQLPPLVEDRPFRWLERAAPAREEIDRLLVQIETWLGPEDLDWVSACAVYPQITRDLTLRCDFWLHGSDPHWHRRIAERLMRIARLPWFRYATMPEWLRRVLVARLTRTQRRAIRAGIESLLTSATSKPRDYFPLEFALTPKLPLHQRLRHHLLRLANKFNFRRQSRRQPYRDHVFLNFMYGRQPGPLSVSIPAAVRQWLFREGTVELGLRPARTLIIAALFSLSLLVYFAGWEGMFDWLNPEEDPSTIVNRRVPPPNITLRENGSGYVVDLGNGLSLDLVSLPGATFSMGSEDGYSREQPVHEVTVNPFSIGRTEVTQAQWRAVMGQLHDVGFEGPTRPVERVSWYGAVRFCERLSELTGLAFRLPTEAEWEYAARGGTRTRFSFGDDEADLGKYAWYYENSESQTHPVATKLPNPFGLYDVHGNVCEWCQDHWSADYQGAPLDGSAKLSGGDSIFRVLRGGSWNVIGNSCRSAYRYVTDWPGSRNIYFGFRVVVGLRT